jgi:hypothetical protein
LSRQIAKRPDLLDRAETKQAVDDLRQLERMLLRLDSRETNDGGRERVRAEAMVGMARHWRTLSHYLEK